MIAEVRRLAEDAAREKNWKRGLHGVEWVNLGGAEGSFRPYDGRK
jgi:hypothetical protein